MDAPRTLQQAIEYFSDATRCHDFAVKMRWSNGPECPNCGTSEVRSFESKVKPRAGRKNQEVRTRHLFECKAKGCGRQFTIKTGTIFEDSPIVLKSWLLAMWMLANCKNGVSSYEIARAIGVTQKSAWFMLHRIRLAMQDAPGPLSGHIEADETFIGGKARNMHKGRKERVLKGRQSGMTGKIAVWGAMERSTPERKSRVITKVVPNVRRSSVLLEVKKNVLAGSTVYTDALRSYQRPASWGPRDLYVHKVIDHAKAYVDGAVHTNGMENFWSLLKRTIKGTYVSVEPFHLFRYLDEQARRFNERGQTDSERFENTFKGVVGRRLTYAGLTAQENPEWM